MNYLLTLGWPWFASAVALGALIGFFAYRLDKDARFTGGWIVVAGVALLVSGAVASGLGLVQGRAALTLDIALLAGLSSAAGLAIGGVMKPAAKALFDSDTKPILHRAVAPVIAASDESSRETPGAPAELHAVLAQMRRVEATLPPPKSGRGRRLPARPGAPPLLLPAPRDGVADDLARIKGLGPKSREKLHAIGVFHYDQIAIWSLDNARWISAALEAPGRVERGKWVQQAQALVSETRRANVA
jgi:predicted flap endonuclease-1-like 5' DNA nuclease